MSLSLPIRNCDLVAFLRIVMCERLCIVPLIDLVAQYAMKKNTHTKKVHLLLHLQGHIRVRDLEDSRLQLVQTPQDEHDYLVGIAKQFGIEEEIPHTGDIISDFRELTSMIPRDHFDDTNLLEIYQLSVKEDGSVRFRQPRHIAHIQGANC